MNTLEPKHQVPLEDVDFLRSWKPAPRAKAQNVEFDKAMQPHKGAEGILQKHED